MEKNLEKIKLLILDVDGVMTDGRVTYDNFGDELKSFSILDGLGIKFLHDSGLKSVILTARKSKIVTHRARDIKIKAVYAGFDKLSLYKKILSKFKVKDEEVCFIGDDILDIAVLKRVGFSACPPNAVEEVKAVVDYTTNKKGGRGAVREVIELILKSKGSWDTVISKYST
ncbi:MAG: HAD-IIIA family hydrolase [Candidatus Omnitrophota bacterium]